MSPLAPALRSWAGYPERAGTLSVARQRLEGGVDGALRAVLVPGLTLDPMSA